MTRTAPLEVATELEEIARRLRDGESGYGPLRRRLHRCWIAVADLENAGPPAPLGDEDEGA